MITVHPVIELRPADEFSLWPVDGCATSGFLYLNGGLSPGVIGAAVMHIAACNNIELFREGHLPRPQEPLDDFLHDLLTLDELFVAGGMRITDTTSDTTLVPGCCSGLNEWRDWLHFLDGNGFPPDLGHDPSPRVEHSGDIVLMKTDTEIEDGPTIEVRALELRELLAHAESDLGEFLRSARIWSEHHLPDHSAQLMAALGRCLDVMVPAIE